MTSAQTWGTYKIIDMEAGVLATSITVRAGCQFTYHSHALRNETWVITKGKGSVILDGNEKSVKAGDTVVIAPGVRHTLKAESELSVIEIQSGSEISKSDKQIFEL